MITRTLSNELNIKEWQTEATIKLIDEGNTIPFIARYRKEATGSLDDEILRKFGERLAYLRNLQEKKEKVLKSIEEQGKLTTDLKESIKKADTLVEVEDIYRPFKPKKRTRATIAKEKGLESLANIILEQKTEVSIHEIAKKYLSEEKEVFTIEEAIQGAKDIIAEIISDNADFRKSIREVTFKTGDLSIEAKDKEKSSEYEMYYEYNEKINNIAIHRILAINRGEKEKLLKIKINAPVDDIIEYLNRRMLIDHSNDNFEKIKPEYNEYTKELIEETVLDSYKRLIAPSIEREIRTSLTETAEEKSILVFSKNLEQLLMQGPIQNKVVLGWDPAFRTGCKLSVVDGFGKVLTTDIIYPTEPQNKVVESKKRVLELIREYNIDIIALGNGTASRESEEIIIDIIKGTDVQYVIVNEAGASVYSASKLATEEFPDFNVGERSAVSIARRLQDPLAELVKIDPKSIGVGQYQHDMNQKKLGESLKSVVEKAVNNVGVDLNTASIALLQYVSGISSTIAKNIIKYREEEGAFKSRKKLLKVSKLGPKAFEQSAGFLKVYGSKNLLDITTVHPESYKATEKLIKNLGYNLNDFKATHEDLKKIHFEKLNNLTSNDFKDLANELDIGEVTLIDIINELKKPGRDPRDNMPQPILRKDALEIEDLEEGMALEGTVRNVVDFGAFVDIGVHQDGLVHISQLVENKFVNHPLDIVSVGDIVEVKVTDVDVERRRIQLSMII
ncbi:putative transcriptional accessory protein [Methanobrevibacter arboriphilus JCM 13429 = DSM 1125]|uniref:Putative transcriptional accessory protein n=1 Tax=Methanobrevibacter arboriphilus JCM 13429 = DSM 1125 TaxID=1300164 RepID=A0A1V6N396_METAZ|nr:Tex family protein [Methanobrevibacter arboriphilus]OQD59145.1 putative transcriptional accessory protein [Methanobrevibacter arboriphilus JCM 13429 = DSM 1125]